MEQKSFDIRDKWGLELQGGLDEGFTVIPNVLLHSQGFLDISASEMSVLLQIFMHWWSVDEWPHPRPSAIAKRIGVTPRSVERSIKSLEEKGLLMRLDSCPKRGNPDITVRYFDLSNLLKKLEEIERSGVLRAYGNGTVSCPSIAI